MVTESYGPSKLNAKKNKGCERWRKVLRELRTLTKCLCLIRNAKLMEKIIDRIHDWLRKLSRKGMYCTHTSCLETFPLFLSWPCKGSVVHFLDAQTPFLNGRIEKWQKLYVNKPFGLESVLRKVQVLRLFQDLYDLKKALII